MVYRTWNIGVARREASLALQKSTGHSALVCDVLLSRGLAEQADIILHKGEPVSSPRDMADMETAAQRLRQAIEDEEKILVFGDYDADGITATAILFSYLESVGAQVYYMLPSREGEGYGLSRAAVETAARAGVNLIVTVDSGVSAVDEIALAATRGMDVIVTDHHLPGDTLPSAVAVVDPMRADDTSSAKTLSGAGVAFKFICAAEECEPEELLGLYADLAALGTVADLMPLTGENRTIVREGLALMQEPVRPGIAALLEQAGLGGEGKPVTAQSISYALAPRLNAAGRMGDAKEALRLLLTDDTQEAESLADALAQYNAQRQKIEQEIMESAVAAIEADPDNARRPVLVVWGEGYHIGVIGIVASRLVERYAKPAIVISLSGDEGKGSGRSMGTFSLYGALTACGDLLVRYGGHEMAAGLTVAKENLVALRTKINNYARRVGGLGRPPLFVDGTADLEKLTVADVEALSALAPFGSGNPPPMFALTGVTVDAVYPMQEGRHTRLRLRKGGVTVYAAHFGAPNESYPYQVGAVVDVAASLSVYAAAAGPVISARVQEIRPAGLADKAVESAARYQLFAMGTRLPEAEVRGLCPERGEVADVYRAVARGRYFTDDLRPLMAALPDLPAGRILAAVDALLELELLAKDKTGALYLCKTQSKRDLNESAVLRALRRG